MMVDIFVSMFYQQLIEILVLNLMSFNKSVLTGARVLFSGWQKQVFGATYRIAFRTKSSLGPNPANQNAAEKSSAWIVQPHRPFGSPNSSFRQTINSCKTVSELSSSASGLLPMSAENAISVLRRATDITPPGVVSHEVARQFSPRVLDDLLASVHDNMHLLSFDQLYTIVAFSLKFNLPVDSRFWISVERQIRFIVPKLDINQLILLVKLFDGHFAGKTQPRSLLTVLADDLAKGLRGRLSEVTKPADLLFALYKFSPPATPASVASTVARELNDRLVACIGRLTPKQLYRAFYVQTRLETRHAPLLRAIAYYLRQPGRLDGLSAVHLLNVLFTCSELNITEPRLVKNVVSEIKRRYGEYSPVNLVSLARSVGSLQLRDTELIAKLIRSGVEQKNYVLLADAIVAAGATGVYPSKDELAMTAGEVVAKHLTQFAKSDPPLWLKVIWSLFALGHDKNTPDFESLILPLFTDQFAKDLVESVDKRNPSSDPVQVLRNPSVRRVRLQMANIRELLRLEHPKIYEKIPSKPSSVIAIPTGDCRIRADRPQFELCLDTFGVFCDAKKYVTLDKPTEGGFCIDFNVYVDKSGELVPTESHLKDHKSSDTLPVAIKVCEFSEQTLLETQPNGLAQLHGRIFALLGYRPVILTTVQLTRTMPVAQRAQNLQDMIKQAAKRQ